MTAPPPANPLHTATALAFSSAGNTLVIVDSVPGHDQRRAGAGEDPEPDEGVGRGGERRHRGGHPEQGDAGEQRRAPPVAIAEDPRRQQQGGEGDREAVDDPLLLRLGGVQANGPGRGGRRSASSCPPPRGRGTGRRRRARAGGDGATDRPKRVARRVSEVDTFGSHAFTISAALAEVKTSGREYFASAAANTYTGAVTPRADVP